MDPKLEQSLTSELKRQQQNIELIASENYVSKEIMLLQGSILTNKYAEGYPGKRYYGGCEYIDEFETLAITYAKQLFGCIYANVQPHSGSSANMAVYKALLQTGDKVMGMQLAHGGHLTHGHPINFSGLDYEIISYPVRKDSHEIDYEELINIAKKEQPKMIIAGGSAYARQIKFDKFREAADSCGAILMVDMAHFAGLVATGLHPSPFPYADVVTSTTHKTLRGPRGGIILTNHEEIAKKVDKMVFPGIQGGPLMHVIGAKAQCFYEALQPTFKTYQTQILKNINAFVDVCHEEHITIIGDETDTHLILMNTKESFGLTGKEAEAILDKIHITVNKNTIPYDQESPFITSGIRIGSPAMTTRGLKEVDFKDIARIIITALRSNDNQKILDELKRDVLALTNKFPVYEDHHE